MKRIAIIGAGISGLVTAKLLSRKHDVTLFEKNHYIGGHTHTVDVEVGGKSYAVDTGFIVFNDRTYPNFIRLLDQLGVKYKPTEMSFSVSNRQSGLEYNGHDLNTLFAQRKNLFSPKFYRLISEILRFNKLCKAQSQSSLGHDCLGDFLSKHQFSDFFQQHYILPMGAAIWSTSIEGMKAFPLTFFLRFFLNHGLLDIKDRPQWYVVGGGSRSYVEPLVRQIDGDIQLNAQISSVQRLESAVIVRFADGSEQQFDEVVFCCHSDEALSLLADADANEQEILSALAYADNEVVLHTDQSLLPLEKRAWASWNYLMDGVDTELPQLTYNMNILQGIKSDETFCVTLNATTKIDASKVLRKFTYAHPQYTVAAANAQTMWGQISGWRRSHFCGAYWFNGFHEDGVNSALRVAEAFGETL
ncbi:MULTISPECIES: NAD(P)/FAD-dependent oxidoreductase [Corallincola]|uniref:FAD-dependent oxidoreductase n=2 Tax=Corallincola TaxID=1775176 RepID=A0ABY1WUC7_9GAMM|nr:MULTISPECIES: FAD-dependent oxidoreductase [Corallincola]TAA48181.1 FAD-dependent oxidoreductase [Corallincola spongiicola]TCI02525.1 FAD-dependent oxidoreductase [Corallincola luteus]